jgi:2-oxoglutarate dehydrogenase E1 component
LKKLIYSARLKTIQDGKDIDWATGEALAFGSLLTEGIHVRLAGQDVERGTFSQRHAVIHSTKDNSLYTPLNHLSGNQAELVITNSHLSEYGALGFELGYSLQRPECLVLWEAQFGDFFNTAQVIVDQFISSGEDKWSRQTGLVMLLPHSYDGQGPEHSSGRIERFLQMSNDHPDYIFPEDKSFQIQKCNWQILNCSTPANYFHALRRQNLRNFRKPLIVFTPKHLLRLPEARSTLEDMADGTKFLPVIGETNDNIVKNGKKVKRVIFCSGKVYYDLLKSRSERKLENVALVRVEQLSPFPFREVAAQAQLYPNAEVVWGQEEPLNMGGYVYCKERIHTALKQLCNRDVYPRYVGRIPSASTAAGHHSQHVRELKVLLDTAFENL